MSHADMTPPPDRRAEEEGSKPLTSDRLRHRIDRGGAADKVPARDPSAAPLGTDDEAAGTPPTAEQLRRAEAAETRAEPQPMRDPVARSRRSGFGPVILVVLLGLAILVTALMMLP